MAKFILDTRMFCYKMQRKDGTGEFVSTRCRDEKGHIHGLALDALTWDAMSNEGISPLDEVTFEGELELPVEGTADYEAAKVTPRHGEPYISGDLRNARPIAIKKGIFKTAKLPTFAELPVYTKRETGPSLSV